MASNSNNSHLPLKNRTAIVTGGSRGIGRAIALHLASLGANLVIAYASNSTAASLVVSSISSSSSSGSSAVAVQANVSDPDAVKSMFDAAESAFGGPAHILVNCAGVVVPKTPMLSQTSVEEWDLVFNVNARGTFLCCREAANRLAHGGR